MARESLFSGEYWTGRQALELGLVDAIGDLRSMLRERFGDKVFMPLIAAERGFLGRRALAASGQRLGTACRSPRPRGRHDFGA